MIVAAGWLLVVVVLSLTAWGWADAPAEPNYDEARVPAYRLPDPLTFADGSKARPENWPRRRAEILELFRANVYGRSPAAPAGMVFDVSPTRFVLGGMAMRKQVGIRFSENPDDPVIDLLIYLPPGAKGPVPLFLGLNFQGNHAVTKDTGVWLSQAWIADYNPGVLDHRATEACRGTDEPHWPLARILQRGYGLAQVYHGDMDPDFDDGFANGVHGLLDPKGPRRAGDAWGALGAWAWGLSRAMDYLQTDAAVDAQRVAVVGHSRLGKAALWAGAQDERFALVISNNSGCGGAALARRRFGETVARISTMFPHWFCGNFAAYGRRVDELPVDQHMLLSLVAPRGLLVCSAAEDRWADPRGEYLSTAEASRVYRMLGAEGLPGREMPAAGRPALGRVGYSLRPGVHDMLPQDWEVYMDMADKVMAPGATASPTAASGPATKPASRPGKRAGQEESIYTDYGPEKELAGETRPASQPRPAHPARPTKRQMEFMDLEVGMFIHFGMNTFTGAEHGDGWASPAAFNPSAVEADQWMAVAKSMGAKYVVFTARHEDGYCLWPTKTTEYCVRNSPWQGGKGDVVKTFTDACRRAGLKAALYHSASFDAHHLKVLKMSKTAHLEMQVGQLKELLSRYGPIEYIWFDHHQGDWYWQEIDRTVAAAQPDCLRFGPDVWILGGHDGKAPETVWGAVDTTTGRINARPTSVSGEPWGRFFRVWETNTTGNGQWFWHGRERSKVASLKELLDKHEQSVGRGANFLLNFAPDDRGRLDDEVVARARQFGEALAKRYGEPIATAAGEGAEVRLELPRARKIDQVVLMEDLAGGQRIASHAVEAMVGGAWREVAAGATVGHKRIWRFEPVTATAVRFRCTESIEGAAKIRRMEVFAAR